MLTTASSSYSQLSMGDFCGWTGRCRLMELISFITGLSSNGENPLQYLDDKTKEKELTKEMKKTYGKDRGSRGIIIKRISEPVTKITTKLMACKFLRKRHNEEVPIGVVAATTQCTKGTMLCWAPYLLNLFLDDSKDVQELGMKFHYSWLIVLIEMIRWGEPTYSNFCDRVGKCRAMRYTSLGSTSYPKRRSGNDCTFAMYLSEMKENIYISWRITLEVVAQCHEIANFKATRHNMCIQACRDPKGEWLQL
jgi:hypothetical protein